MLKVRPTQLLSVCLSCRLRLLEPALLLQRRGLSFVAAAPTRTASTSAPRAYSSARSTALSPSRRSFTARSRQGSQQPPTSQLPAEPEVSRRPDESTLSPLPPPEQQQQLVKESAERDAEQAARRARQLFGDTLPQEFLSNEQQKIYERLYGPAVETRPDEQIDEIKEVEETGKRTLFRLGKNGEYEEVEYHSGNFGGNIRVDVGGSEVLRSDREDMEAHSRTGKETDDVTAATAQSEDIESAEDEAHPEEELWEMEEGLDEEVDEFFPEDETARSHPLTKASRWTTFPSTVFLPKTTLTDHTEVLLAQKPSKHLLETAHRVFGGPGLPLSSATARAGSGIEQKPVALNAAQIRMSDIEADVFMAAVMPGTYAAVLAVITEVRRRLGSKWIEGIIKKENGPRVLDAGAGGAGVIAWREVLRAEWARMQERELGEENTSIMGDGTEQPHPPPLGKAAVITGSDALRFRASRLLDDTAFLPRLPEIVTEESQGATQRKLYDIIIAPHALWHLKEDYLRKQQVQTLWSLLDPTGGVLILLEKGLPRGFEVIAGARQLLLDKHIASPSDEVYERPLTSGDEPDGDRYVPKETGMIIAPCTNHTACPMYRIPGKSKDRKDFCYFKQRYIRPSYLQQLLGAKNRNHEDVQFSYLAVQRGQDLRTDSQTNQPGILQGEHATDVAFAGYEDIEDGAEATVKPFNALSLPRTILQPLKRRGHIILDVCTPSGTLERWTVPRSFSKQAFRDARKARWGDLWALGAKTRVPRNVRLGDREELKDKRKKKTTIKKAPLPAETEDGPALRHERLRGEKGRTKGKRRRLEEKARVRLEIPNTIKYA